MKRKSYLLIMALIALVCVAGCTAKTGENTSTNPEFQDPDADAQAEIEEYFLGSFMTENEEVDLTISDNGDGTYGVRFGIFRLCSMDEGVGTYDEHKISFTTIDPSGEPMEGVIYRDSENSLTLKITNSTWSYIESDTEYPGLFRV